MNKVKTIIYVDEDLSRVESPIWLPVKWLLHMCTMWHIFK